MLAAVGNSNITNADLGEFAEDGIEVFIARDCSLSCCSGNDGLRTPSPRWPTGNPRARRENGPIDCSDRADPFRALCQRIDIAHSNSLKTFRGTAKGRAA